LRSTTLSLLACALLIFSCSPGSSDPPAIEEIEGPLALGQAQKVYRLRQLWLSEQPDPDGFEAARQRGVAVVIDLRAPGERTWDEERIVRDLGMDYHGVPVAGLEGFTPEVFARVEQIVADNRGEQILVHCSSGNRAAAWLATHLVTQHAMPPTDALALARHAGLTKAEVADRVSPILEQIGP
jgi:protein tyrosine phosphatase (PTP) superfamily phosphohydrolase (DUF442 family)